MKKLKEYDKAASQFYAKKNFKKSPLLSWDIYSLYLDKLTHLSKDVIHLNKIAQSWRETWNFKNEIQDKGKVIILTDASQKIVYTTSNMKTLNGYSMDQVVGHSPKIFQGDLTCQTTSAYIRKAIEKQEPFEAKVLKYKKDGTIYFCTINGYPVHNKKGKLINFIAFERIAS